MIKTILFTVLLSLLPISELRGAIPYAYFNDIPLWASFAISVIANAMVSPIAIIFLQTLHKLFYKIGLYKRFFDKTVVKARIKVGEKVNKYGYWGLMVFVAIPLPITGAWTGSIGAWILNLDKKKSCLYVALGILISGLIVSAILLTGIGLSSIFIKNVVL